MITIKVADIISEANREKSFYEAVNKDIVIKHNDVIVETISIKVFENQIIINTRGKNEK